MNDYISKNEVLNLIMHNDKVCHYADERYENVVYVTAKTICKVVADMPAADVQPVKRGEWDFRGYQLFKCTSCKEIFTQNQLEAMVNHTDDEFVFPNFCPNCGARMIKDGDKK